jgi:hypothetical protein
MLMSEVQRSSIGEWASFLGRPHGWELGRDEAGEGKWIDLKGRQGERNPPSERSNRPGNQFDHMGRWG